MTNLDCLTESRLSGRRRREVRNDWEGVGTSLGNGNTLDFYHGGSYLGVHTCQMHRAVYFKWMPINVYAYKFFWLRIERRNISNIAQFSIFLPVLKAALDIYHISTCVYNSNNSCILGGRGSRKPNSENTSKCMSLDINPVSYIRAKRTQSKYMSLFFVATNLRQS